MNNKKKEKEEKRLLNEVSMLKKDVYFSYLINLNNRYIYQEMYEKIERLYYVKNILNKYNVEIDDLDKKTNINKVHFTKEELEELEEVKRTKEISIKSLSARVKRKKNLIRQIAYENIISKKYKYITIGLALIYVIKGVIFD